MNENISFQLPKQIALYHHNTVYFCSLISPSCKINTEVIFFTTLVKISDDLFSLSFVSIYSDTFLRFIQFLPSFSQGSLAPCFIQC